MLAMKGRTWVIGLFLALLGCWSHFQGVDTGKTTPNIQEIFLGRCHDFQETLQPSLTKDCNQLWQFFHDAFAGKFHCNVTVEDYDLFAVAASYNLPENKHIFWEGVYEFVHQLSYRGTRYTAVSDILTGYLADRLVWCGDENGINTDSECPTFGQCENEVQRSFWRSVSRVFAAGAHGEAFVMLNGTTGQAYRNTSVFAQYELKYLQSPRVTKLTAFVASRLGSQVKETCDCSSCTIRQLEQDVQKQGLQFACEDNPLEVLYMMCVDSPNAPQCTGLTSSANDLRQRVLLIVTSTILALWGQP